MGQSLETLKAKLTDLTIHALQFHPHEALPRQTPHGIIHPRRPEPRTARNLPRQMRTQRGPRAAVAMQPQDARETLEVVVHEGVIELLRGVFGRGRHHAVSREKREFGAGGSAQGRGMHAQAAQIAHDEAGGGECGTREAQEHVLRVRFEADAIVKQRWDDGRDEKTRIPFLTPERNLAILFGKLKRTERLLIEEHESLFL